LSKNPSNALFAEGVFFGFERPRNFSAFSLLDEEAKSTPFLCHNDQSGQFDLIKVGGSLLFRDKPHHTCWHAFGCNKSVI
jgi:hypothetical protein